MQKIVIIAALATLAACSQKPEAPAAEASTEAAAATAAAEPIAADGKPSVGKFKITDKDGKVYMEEDKADGTYVGTVDGKVVETGRWNQPNPNKFCYTKDEKEAKEVCNEEGVTNGVWTSRNAKGEVSTVERVG